MGSTFGYFWVLEYVSGQELVRKWSEIIRIWSRIDKQTKKRGKYRQYSLSAEGAKACSKKRKRSTILPHFYGSIFFCVIFFSFCSNLSIWPGRQIVPYESRCYTPIFDGLVNLTILLSQT